MVPAKYGVLVSLCVFAIAVPFDSNLTYPRGDIMGRAEDFYLRIMPLGASITKGDPAAPGTNGNGYRKPLRDQLRFDGWQVNMVGTRSFGTMQDSDNEGYPGARVEEIRRYAAPAISTFKPNLVLINAGTNDGTQNYEVSSTGDRMRRMIIECFTRAPNTVVILSTLIPNGVAPSQVAAINDQYRNLAAKLRSEGFYIVLAEMDDGFITIDEIFDGTHPDAVGFQKMAAVWRHAINQAEKNGWIKKPSDDVSSPDGSHGTTCPKVFGSGSSDPRAGMQILTANTGLIYDDGTYKHSSTDMNVLFYNPDYASGEFYLAQLVNLDNVGRGGARDDLIYVDKFASSTTMFVNEGDGKFGPAVKIDVHDGCPADGIHWGDVNNDGLDDFICIGPEGNMYVSINEGGNPPIFRSLGGTYKIHPDGYSKVNVRLGDIDGDGRLDYCVVAGNGDIYCWRNGGLGATPAYWQDLGKVAPGRDMGDINGVKLVDLNGDGRSDWLWLDKQGRVTTYINQRGDGDGMAPKWLSAGVTHDGMGEDTKGRNNVLFGQLYSERADYVWINRGDILGEPITFAHVWRNDGGGGKHQKGDGAHWGDMDGNGNDDYVWISPDGKVVIFRNLNTPPDTSKFNGGGGWDAAKVNLETGFDRQALHVGDWDGDGKADIIGVDKHSGTITVWTTNYAGPHEFSFTKEVIPNSNKCNQGWGVGLFDIGAFFVDLTGSGRVDYLCMEPNGRTVAWLNEGGGSLRYVGQVKFSEELDRANHRFADVNGDGRADFLWVDKFNGDTNVWYNLGEIPNGGHVEGSSFRWSLQGKLYQGSSRGPNLHFPNIGGLGRADMVDVNPTTAKGFVWFNSCPHGGDDTSGPVPDPGLPIYNPSGPIEPSDPDDDDNADKFCGKENDNNGGDWTPSLWNELGVGDRFDLSSRSEGWPTPTDTPDGPTNAGVPRIIARFGLLNEDGLFNWPGVCQDISGTCAFSANDLVTHCRSDWERAFTLWAIGNFATYLQKFARILNAELSSSSLSLAKMTTTFIASQNSDLPLDGSAWLSLLSGVVSGVAAGLPGAGSVAGGGLSAVLGIASTLVSAAASAEVEEPRFSVFADLSNDYAKMRDTAIAVASNYYDRLLATHPDTKNVEQGTELSNLLKSGVFADQYLGTGDTQIDPALLRKMAKAPIIGEIWNSQRLFITKFQRGKIDIKFDPIAGPRNFTYDPCYGKANFENRLGGKYYCPHGEAGLGEYNYLLLSWDTYTDVMFNNYGTAQKDISPFGVDIIDMVASAVRVQDVALDFIPRSPNVMSDIFLRMAQDPTNIPPMSQALFVNIPICDLTDLELEWNKGLCTITDPDYEPTNENLFLLCMNYVLMETCAKYKLDDKAWPYATDLHGFD